MIDSDFAMLQGRLVLTELFTAQMFAQVLMLTDQPELHGRLILGNLRTQLARMARTTNPDNEAVVTQALAAFERLTAESEALFERFKDGGAVLRN